MCADETTNVFSGFIFEFLDKFMRDANARLNFQDQGPLNQLYVGYSCTVDHVYLSYLFIFLGKFIVSDSHPVKKTYTVQYKPFAKGRGVRCFSLRVSPERCGQLETCSKLVLSIFLHFELIRNVYQGNCLLFT